MRRFIAPGVVIGVPVGPLIIDRHDDRLPPRRASTPPRAAAPPPRRRPPQPAARRGISLPLAGERRLVPDEVLIEAPTNVSERTLDAIARRHRLTRLESHDLRLLNTRLQRWRIADRRSVRNVLRALGAERNLGFVQPNYLFALQIDAGAPRHLVQADIETAASDRVSNDVDAPEGDPAQYVIAKLGLAEAHRLARGDKVLVAVIDSVVDESHPDLAGVVVKRFNALAAEEGAHSHGTAMAGAIAARGRLLGVAPQAQLMAVSAFSASAANAQGTSFNIIRGLEWAVLNGARVINMSFAGPSDPLMRRMLAAARARGALLVAAAGNAGAKSPPLYPAADANVVAVTATDAADRLFARANRGKHIAVAAPGVGILAPAPEGRYQLTSGTSIAAAHVSGVAALLIERGPALDPDAVEAILLATARDLGVKGRDEEFGAGLADPVRAIAAVAPHTAAAPPPR